MAAPESSGLPAGDGPERDPGHKERAGAAEQRFVLAAAEIPRRSRRRRTGHAHVLQFTVPPSPPSSSFSSGETGAETIRRLAQFVKNTVRDD